MSTSITFIKDNAFTLASLTAAFVAYKIAVNASNIAFKAHYVWLVISKTAAAAYRTTVATVRAAHILLQMGLAKLQGNWVRQSWLMADLKKQGAMLASGYGALIAVAILLGATLYKVYKRMTEVSQSEKDLMEIRKRGQEGIIEEKNKIDALLAVARDENKSLKDRHAAIDALNRIVPEYNGQLDDTTGKYKENKKALDEYIKSLTRKYEIEGAKDKLKEIGTERVTLELQKRQQEKIVEQDKKDAEREVFVPGPEGKTMAMSSAGLRNKHKGDLRNTNEKLAELDERKKAITDVYGEDIMKEELDNVKKEKTETQQADFTRTTDDKKEKNEDVLKEEKDWRTREQALNRIAYAKGEKDFEEYTNRMTEIEMEYNQKVMANGKATTEQKMEAEAAYYEAKKKFAMQVIQAVAQTAQNAISAYGSAAAIPLVGYILAPVAAAMAVAAGAIQIAAIKKQQQASESQGYAKGGFTPSGPKLKEVGVVHAGEWVASQEMLASPVASPIIEALDYAQRTNTIGSLRADDVSRTIAPVTYNTPQQQQRVIVQQKPDGLSAAAIVQNTKVMQEYKETMSALKDRLNEPFVTVNTVTGDSGIKQAQDEYNILIRNKTPKSRRK